MPPTGPTSFSNASAMRASSRDVGPSRRPHPAADRTQGPVRQRPVRHRSRSRHGRLPKPDHRDRLTRRRWFRDRDGQFIAAFDEIFATEGKKSLKTPVRTPVASSFAEGWIGTLRRELVDRTIIWNRQQLERLVIDYIDHCNTHRPRRSLDQEPTQAQPDQQPAAPPHPHVVISTCFNGLISEYRSAA
jgi:hypothetical protein